jgi:hypothetical protein
MASGALDLQRDLGWALVSSMRSATYCLRLCGRVCFENRHGCEGTPREHQRGHLREHAVNRLRPFPSSYAAFVVARARVCPRFPSRRSMVRRGQRFESVRGLRRTPANQRKVLPGSVTRGHYLAFPHCMRARAVFGLFKPIHPAMTAPYTTGNACFNASSQLNVRLSFAGLTLRDDGRVATTKRATTLLGGRRTGERAALEATREKRSSGCAQVLSQRALCRKNDFHAVFKATKSMRPTISASSSTSRTVGLPVARAPVTAPAELDPSAHPRRTGGDRFQKRFKCPWLGCAE